METITPEEAKEQGYKAITYGYALPKQRKMFNRAMALLDDDNIDYKLVKDKRVVSIWRREEELDNITISNM